MGRVASVARVLPCGVLLASIWSSSPTPINTLRSFTPPSDESGSPLKLDIPAINAEAEAKSPSSAGSGSSSGDSLRANAPMASPNAKTREETLAQGKDTYGALNQHPLPDEHETGFKVGVSVDRNKKCRRTMEDAHSFIYDFGGIRGQGYFAVFDGHAGKHAAEWCGEHFHEHLLESLRTAPATPVPDLLNSTFHLVDTRLSLLSSSQGTHSGCTAVTAFLRLEDSDGNPVGDAAGVGKGVDVKEGELRGDSEGALKAAQLGEGTELQRMSASGGLAGSDSSGRDNESEGRRADIKAKIKAVLTGKPDPSSTNSGASTPADESDSEEAKLRKGTETPKVEIKGPAEVRKAEKRTLYTANVGDARAVLGRAGRAVRLTYDHKGSDSKEAKRITDAGGFVMNNRVNGVLAVTRSLGDSSMKEFVVGSPYTTETTLGDEDEWLIVACDGLWDVCQDQEAIDLIADVPQSDPQEASRRLLDHALQNFSSDNLSVLVVSLKPHSGGARAGSSSHSTAATTSDHGHGQAQPVDSESMRD